MPDKKKTVEEYIADLTPDQQAIVGELRKIVKAAAPEAKESVKWAQPVYEVNGPMVYIKAFKSQVNFGFWRGTQLTDPQNLLEGDGDRMKHIKLRTLNDVKKDVFTRFVKEAAKLNQEQGNPTQGKRS